MSFAWKAEYVLGIKILDDQHRRFLELCDVLAADYHRCYMGQSDNTRLLTDVFKLRLHAFQHFQTEETLMITHDYPDAVEHMQKHDDFLAGLRDFMAGLSKAVCRADDGDPDKERIKGTVKWLVRWWAKHIGDDDRRLAEALRSAAKKS